VGGRWPQDVTATPRRAFVNERVVTYALLVRARGIVTLARASAQDLFDQKTAFGRLALVHVIMMAGDTLVTVSLAGSLFFSVSPTEAKGKVLLYLLLTIAPFAVVSPILGPLIDRSANGRRILVAISAGVRAALCWMMAEHLNSLWLFPLAFLLLISSKLYVVTRGALVPEMARTDQFREHGDRVDDAGWPNPDEGDAKGYAGFNAQLTLLGTLSGLIAGSVGAGILKGIGAPSVLYVAAFVYIGATVASARLQKPVKIVRDQVAGLTQSERDLNALNPLGDVEVAWGLGAASLMRFSAGFTIFLLAFGLRRESAGLGWYAFALLLSAGGSLVGLAFVTRVRNVLKESTLLTIALLATGLGAPWPLFTRSSRCRFSWPAGWVSAAPSRSPVLTPSRRSMWRRRAGSHLRALRRASTVALGRGRVDTGGHRHEFLRRRPPAGDPDGSRQRGVPGGPSKRAYLTSTTSTMSYGNDSPR
jgi:hypothetical protein